MAAENYPRKEDLLNTTFTSGSEQPHQTPMMQTPPTVEDVLRSVRGLKMGFPPFFGIELRVDPDLVANQYYMAVSQELFDELEKQK